jgi:hypothetical protein
VFFDVSHGAIAANGQPFHNSIADTDATRLAHKKHAKEITFERPGLFADQAQELSENLDKCFGKVSEGWS